MSVNQVNQDASKIVDYFKNLQDIHRQLDFDRIKELVVLLRDKREANSNVFIIGNGGSASTAAHFVADLGVGSLTRANPVKAISLCDNVAVITAISNDLEYAAIFEQQLKLLGKPRDLLILISASGNSQNLVRATETAQAMGISVFSLTGFSGGKLKEMTGKNNIHVDTPVGAYGLVEDTHLAICHIVTECIREQ